MIFAKGLIASDIQRPAFSKAFNALALDKKPNEYVEKTRRCTYLGSLFFKAAMISLISFGSTVVSVSEGIVEEEKGRKGKKGKRWDASLYSFRGTTNTKMETRDATRYCQCHVCLWKSEGLKFPSAFTNLLPVSQAFFLSSVPSLSSFYSLHSFTSQYIMGKEILCAGCKKKFQNGRPYSMHIKSCRDIDSAVDEALKKHKDLVAKKLEEKKAAAIAKTSPPQAFPDDQMDVDMESDVNIQYSFLFLSFILHLYRILYHRYNPLWDRHRHLQGLQVDLVDEHAYHIATVMICHLKPLSSLISLRNPRKMRHPYPGHP